MFRRHRKNKASEDFTGSRVIRIRRGFSRPYSCGHRDSRRYTLVVHGAKIHSTARNTGQSVCPKCQLANELKYAKRCTFCSIGIPRNTTVAFFDRMEVRDWDPEQLEYAVFHEGYVVGCVACAKSTDHVAAYYGRWDGENFYLQGMRLPEELSVC